MPGSELRDFLGSEAADIPGSNNIIGIKNQVADALIKEIISAQEKEDYIAYVKALDRVLLHEYYIIPQWYSPVSRVAYWDKFGQPTTDIKTGFQPLIWWKKE